MKKKKKAIQPLQLNKETVAKLDDKTLKKIAGGAIEEDEVTCGVSCHVTCTMGGSCVGGPG